MKSNEQNNLLSNILEIPAETQTIEFKRLLGDKVVAKTIISIVAMANTDGGAIILGVADPEQTKLKDFDRIHGIEESLEVFDSIGHEIKRIVPRSQTCGRLPLSMCQAVIDV